MNKELYLNFNYDISLIINAETVAKTKHPNTKILFLLHFI